MRGEEYCNHSLICPSNLKPGVRMGTGLQSGSVAHALKCVSMNDSYSSRLASLVLPDVDGKKVQLGSLWADRPAVLVFLRHWG